MLILYFLLKLVFIVIPIRFHYRSFDMPTINQIDSKNLSNSFFRKYGNSSILDFDIIAKMPTIPHTIHDSEYLIQNH